jgi:hypothetical protein
MYRLNKLDHQCQGAQHRGLCEDEEGDEEDRRIRPHVDIMQFYLTTQLAQIDTCYTTIMEIMLSRLETLIESPTSSFCSLLICLW